MAIVKKILVAIVIWFAAALLVQAIVQSNGISYSAAPSIVGGLAAIAYLIISRRSDAITTTASTTEVEQRLNSNNAHTPPLELTPDMVVPPNEGGKNDDYHGGSYDKSSWNTLRQFDPTISPALKQITPLGEKWAEEFAFRVTSCPSSERNVANIAKEIIAEYAASQRISSNDQINEW